MNPKTLHPESPFLAKIKEAEEHKGRIHTIRTVRPCKVRASYDGPRIEKRMTVKGRVAHNYNNQASTIEAHASGEREKLGTPDWKERVSAAISRHKTTGREFLEFQPLPESRPIVEFTRGGEVVSKAEIAAFLLASETSEKEKGDWMMVGLDTVIGFD